MHPNLLPSQIKKYPSDVQCVYQFITSLFISLLSDNMGLISLSSGLIPTGRDAADMLEAESKGETEVLKVINERLVNQSIEVGSFTTILYKLVKLRPGKVVQFSSQSDVLGKIAIIQQSRNVDLKEVFCYPLGPVPWSVAYGSDDMIETSKCALMTELEKGATDADQVRRPFMVVIDGMAMVRKARNKEVNLDEFADELLK